MKPGRGAYWGHRFDGGREKRKLGEGDRFAEAPQMLLTLPSHVTAPSVASAVSPSASCQAVVPGGADLPDLGVFRVRGRNLAIKFAMRAPFLTAFGGRQSLVRAWLSRDSDRVLWGASAGGGAWPELQNSAGRVLRIAEPASSDRLSPSPPLSGPALASLPRAGQPPPAGPRPPAAVPPRLAAPARGSPGGC